MNRTKSIKVRRSSDFTIIHLKSILEDIFTNPQKQDPKLSISQQEQWDKEVLENYSELKEYLEEEKTTESIESLKQSVEQHKQDTTNIKHTHSNNLYNQNKKKGIKTSGSKFHK